LLGPWLGDGENAIASEFLAYRDVELLIAKSESKEFTYKVTVLL